MTSSVKSPFLIVQNWQKAPSQQAQFNDVQDAPVLLASVPNNKPKVSQKPAQSKAKPLTVYSTDRFWINGSFRRFEAFISKKQANFVVYKDATTAWYLTAPRANGRLYETDWRENTGVYKNLLAQILKSEPKAKPLVNPNAGQQFRAYTAADKPPAEGNWLTQGLHGLGEVVKPVQNTWKQFWGATPEKLADEDARKRYYAGVNVDHIAYKSGKAIGNIGTGIAVAATIEAAAPESLLAATGKILLTRSAQAGIPTLAAAQTIAGVRDKDPEGVIYGLAGLGGFIGKFGKLFGVRQGASKGMSNAQTRDKMLEFVKTIDAENARKMAATLKKITPEAMATWPKDMLAAYIKGFENSVFHNMHDVQTALAKLRIAAGVVVPTTVTTAGIAPLKPQPQLTGTPTRAALPPAKPRKIRPISKETVKQITPKYKKPRTTTPIAPLYAPNLRQYGIDPALIDATIQQGKLEATNGGMGVSGYNIGGRGTHYEKPQPADEYGGSGHVQNMQQNGGNTVVQTPLPPTVDEFVAQVKKQADDTVVKAEIISIRLLRIKYENLEKYIQKIQNLGKINKTELSKLKEILSYVRKAYFEAIENWQNNLEKTSLIPKLKIRRYDHGVTVSEQQIIGKKLGNGQLKDVFDMPNSGTPGLVIATPIDKYTLLQSEGMQREVDMLRYLQRCGIKTISGVSTAPFIRKIDGVLQDGSQARIMYMNKFPDGSVNSKDIEKMTQAEWDSTINKQTLIDIRHHRDIIIKKNMHIIDMQFLFIPNGELPMIDPVSLQKGVSSDNMIYLNHLEKIVETSLQRIAKSGKSASNALVTFPETKWSIKRKQAIQNASPIIMPRLAQQ